MLCSEVHREHQGALCRPMASVVAVGPPQCLLKQEQNDAAPKTSPIGCTPEQIQWYSCFLLNSCSEPVGVTARLYGSVASAAFVDIMPTFAASVLQMSDSTCVLCFGRDQTICCGHHTAFPVRCFLMIGIVC